MDGLLMTIMSIISVLVTPPQEIHSVTPNLGPVHIGCYFMDPETKAMPNNKWVDEVDMSIELCIDHCSANEQTLAGIYNGKTCVCSEALPTQEAHASYCKTLCPGNNGERCGGPKTVSVYSICDAIHYYKNCEYLCFCDKKVSCNFMTGVCLNKKCDFKHEGTRCDSVKDAAFVKFMKSIAKGLQYLWKLIKGYFIVEEQIPAVCDNGRYGIKCEIACHCASGIKCDRWTGVCVQNMCAIGWIGRRCDKPNPCDNNPCLNNGRCELVGLKTVCHCAPQYSGRNCDVVDPCSTNPCRNGGTCKSQGSNFKCECTQDFYGNQCEADLRNAPDKQVYISCFREVEKDREFLKQMTELNQNQVTPSACSRRCRARSYTYAGLQDGNQCWCSNTVGMHGGIPDSECRRPCSGDKSQRCGERNANSVYAACPIGHYKIDCKSICNCLRDQCDLTTGNCPEQSCKIGFIGPRCDTEMIEPTGTYAKRKTLVVLMLFGYTAFVIIETVVFVLQHFRIIRRLPIAALTPEGVRTRRWSVVEIPSRERVKPRKTAPEPLGPDIAADQNPPTTIETQDKTLVKKVPTTIETQDKTSVKKVPTTIGTQDKTSVKKVPTTIGTQDKTSVKNVPTSAGASVMPIANEPPTPSPIATVPMPGASFPMTFTTTSLHSMPSYGHMSMMPMQPSYAHTPMMPAYNPVAVQYPYSAQPMMPAVPPAIVNMPTTADEKHEDEKHEDEKHEDEKHEDEKHEGDEAED